MGELHSKYSVFVEQFRIEENPTRINVQMDHTFKNCYSMYTSPARENMFLSSFDGSCEFRKSEPQTSFKSPVPTLTGVNYF